jgi:NADH-quinone oxidoreductase subunit E
MPWKTLDRHTPQFDPEAPPLINAALKKKILDFVPRYETNLAALLPALHMAQETLGHLSDQALVEIARILEIPPSRVLDTASFYTHYWREPRGRKVVMVCRSISCEVTGGREVLAECKRVLGIDEHETTPDGEYSLVTEECLACCDHGPCMLVGEKLHKRVRPEQVKDILADPTNDRIDVPRSSLYDGVKTDGKKTESAE